MLKEIDSDIDALADFDENEIYELQESTRERRERDVNDRD